MDRQASPLDNECVNHTSVVNPQLRSPGNILQTIRQRIQDAAATQEKLSSAREDLLVKREEARASSKKVQAKRSEAGNAEAAFMNYVRDFIHQTQNPSAQMLDLYNNVESTRNDLGVLEADHHEIERTLNGADWMFMEEENEFYQYGLSELFEAIPDGCDHEAPINVDPSQVSTFAAPSRPPPPPLFPAKPSYQYQLDDVNLEQLHTFSSFSSPSPPLSQTALILTGPTPVLDTRPMQGFSTPTSSLIYSPGSIGKSVQQVDHSSMELGGLGNQFGPLLQLDLTPLNINDAAADDSSENVSRSTFSLHSSSVTHTDGSSTATCSKVGNEKIQDDDMYPSAKPFSKDERHLELIESNGTKDAPPQITDAVLSTDAYDVGYGRAAKNRVREWLFTLLLQNPIEQSLYKNILEDTLKRYGFQYPKGERWGLPAKQYWNRDSCSGFEIDIFTNGTASSGTTNDAMIPDTFKPVSCISSCSPLLLANPVADMVSPRALSSTLGWDARSWKEIDLDRPAVLVGKAVESRNIVTDVTLPHPAIPQGNDDESIATERFADLHSISLPMSADLASPISGHSLLEDEDSQSKDWAAGSETCNAAKAHSQDRNTLEAWTAPGKYSQAPVHPMGLDAVMEQNTFKDSNSSLVQDKPRRDRYYGGLQSFFSRSKKNRSLRPSMLRRSWKPVHSIKGVWSKDRTP